MSQRKSDFNKSNLTARQVANAVEEGKKKSHIVNDTPLEFPDNTKTGFITTHELADDINKVMENLFEDFYGSVVSVVPMQVATPIRVELYFRPIQENTESTGAVQAFKPIYDSRMSTGSLKDKVYLTTHKAVTNRSFEMTTEGADLLYDFLSPDTQKSVAWDRPETFAPLCTETVDRFVYCSIDVDVHKILAFLYGSKENNEKFGSKLTYKIVPVRPTTNVVDPTALGANWVLSMSVMSLDTWEKNMAKIGINFNQGRTPIIVSRRNRT